MFNSLLSTLNLKYKKLKISGYVLFLMFIISIFFPFQINAQPFMVGMHDNYIQTFNSTNFSTVSAEFPLTLPGRIVNKGKGVTWNSDNQLYYAIVETDPEFLYIDYHLVIVDPSTGNCIDLGTIGNVRTSSFTSITYCPADSNLYYMYQASPPEFFYRFFTLYKYKVATGAITACRSYSYSSDSFNLNPLVSYNPDDGYLYNLYTYSDLLTNTSGIIFQKFDIINYNATPVSLSGNTLGSTSGGIMYLGSDIFALAAGAITGSKGYKVTSSGVVNFISDMPYDKVVGFGYADMPLPVELSSFNSFITGNNVTLNWTTSSETNNSGFNIERSSGNDQWTIAGNVAGKGTSTVSQSYSFTDRNLASGNYNYRLKQIDFNGNFEYYNLSNEVNVGIPSQYTLSQNYPNPFNPITNLKFGISELGMVSLKVYDISGKEVMTLVNEVKQAGYYTVNFNGANLPSGVYFYTLSAGNFTATKRMLLIK